MVCETCKTEAAIMESRIEVTGDTSPEEETEVFSVLKFHCRNPACPKYGQEVGEIKHKIS